VEMPQQQTPSIPPHTHCKVCGKAIPMGKIYCSNECREIEIKNEQRAKRFTRIYTIFFIALLIFIVLMTVLAPKR
jgi:predicted nucleic acid-binding Zn ribbon protein